MTQLMTMLKSLQDLAVKADEQRLMVFADEFEAAFPEYAADVEQLMTKPALEALHGLAGKYTAFKFLLFVPAAVGWIDVLQRAYAARAARETQMRDYMLRHPPRAS